MTLVVKAPPGGELSEGWSSRVRLLDLWSEKLLLLLGKSYTRIGTS